MPNLLTWMKRICRIQAKMTQIKSKTQRPIPPELQIWITQKNLSSEEETSFLSRLLYAVYYNEFNTKKPDLWPLLAESIPQNRLQFLIEQLSENERLTLLCECFLDLKEGQWLLLQCLPQPFQKYLKTKYHYVFHLEKVLKENPDISLFEIQKQLDEYAENEVDTIHQLLPELIKRIIDSPVTGYEALEKLKGTQTEENPSAKEAAQQARKHLQSLFRTFTEFSYTPEQLKAFFQIFGLSGYYLNVALTADGNAMSPLKEKLLGIFTLFETPWTIDPEIRPLLIQFIWSLCQKLYAFHHNPDLLLEGLKKITFALPTRGELLPSQSWLPSLLESLTALCQHLHYEISHIPVFIFDQSNKKQRLLNHQFIEILKDRFGASIFHISSDEAIKLAKKLAIEKWIITRNTKEFGFGGARNCAFFLAPVLHQLFLTKETRPTKKDLKKFSNNPS